MRMLNPENERIKRRYFTYLKEAKRYSEATIDRVAKSLSRFEDYTRSRGFRAFRAEQAVAFKRNLTDQVSEKSGERLSKATLYATLTDLRNFFHWLAGQPGFRSRLSYSDADYFNLSEKDTRIAKAQRERSSPTLEQIMHVIRSMPAGTEIEMRDRAVIAFAILTGARDGAIASIRLKHVDVLQGKVHQDAREVHTKFSKTFTSCFFPVGHEVLQVVIDWIEHLRKVKLWGDDDPLFPATGVKPDANGHFAPLGLERKPWSSATPIREIFRRSFTAAGLPYFNPHSFRKTLALLGEKLCRTPEEFKAWSQNLGHEKVLTTFTNYGALTHSRQAEILQELWDPAAHYDEELQLARRLVRAARRSH